MYKKIEICKVSSDVKSSLYFAENFNFKTKRFFYVLDINMGEKRGAHAHKETSQLLWVTEGSLMIEALDERGNTILSEKLSVNSDAILFDHYVWLNIESLQDGTSFFCLTDANYSEDDYIRNPKDFFVKKFK